MNTTILGVITLVVGLVVGTGIGYFVPDANAATLERDAKYWRQATAIFEPAPLKTMTDHLVYMTPDGQMLLAYQFDNFDLSKAQNLNWIAVGIPGKWCKEDQQRIERLFGPGFTYFHDLVKDTHGGSVVGQDGMWFKHNAVRQFEAPWGAVGPGVDVRFMPTEAPSCA
ncbi:MAG: hypothetical protein FJ358_01230 [Thaumarchaeota archaeon]|nr:hypothetical protein [Nitrososphaerota archaeon]